MFGQTGPERSTGALARRLPPFLEQVTDADPQRLARLHVVVRQLVVIGEQEDPGTGWRTVGLVQPPWCTSQEAAQLRFEESHPRREPWVARTAAKERRRLVQRLFFTRGRLARRHPPGFAVPSAKTRLDGDTSGHHFFLLQRSCGRCGSQSRRRSS